MTYGNILTLTNILFLGVNKMENLPSTSKNKRWEKPWTDDELLEYLMKDDDSVILGLSDADDENMEETYGCLQENDTLEEINKTILEEEIEDRETENREINNCDVVEKEVLESSNQNSESIVADSKRKQKEFFENYSLTDKKDVRWRSNVTYETQPIEWFIPEKTQIDELSAPISYFLKYVPDSLFEQMSEMTNLYATQKNIPRFSPTTKKEIKKFIGIQIIMGNLKFPKARLYWNPHLGTTIIKENMTFNRFSKLRNAIHLVDVTARGQNTDRVWKVRDFYNAIRNRCSELQLETNLCVDEQIIPFKGQINIKQYLPKKPKKWGIKLWILAGQSGMIYDFIIYQGAGTEIKNVYSQFGQGAGTVMQLAERISEKYHGLYFDNFFSSYHLFQYLKNKCIMAVGTIRVNRFCKPKLLSDKELKHKGRGSFDIAVSDDGIIITKWYDNKPVLIASNFVAAGKIDSCRRWDAASKDYVMIPRPESITLYNSNMGGVDKLDFLLSIYRSYTRSRKWTVRMITHAVDIALVNSWLEYKKEAQQIGVQPRKIMHLWDFRQSIAQYLILHKDPLNRGRPVNVLEKENVPNTKRMKTETRPISEQRYDNFGHFPQVDGKKESTRCKLENCRRKSRTFCIKCNVHLCLVSERNCFLKFHSK